ncbi:MAG: hypothetical protein QG656_938, partial [Candidatus Hydrogenedentes bacterium]|nr:hypothetical protein [Candidatus Hydrogenedentota bacterium]
MKLMGRLGTGLKGDIRDSRGYPRCGVWVGAVLVSFVACVSHGAEGDAMEANKNDLAKRGVATTEPGHPGNVFLADEDVIIHAPAGETWRALDDRGNVVALGALDMSDGSLTASLKQPGIGWYKVEFLAEDKSCAGWTTAAVLARPLAPVPEDSPVCVDAALSWLSEDADERAHLAGLAALAGVNWIRDRIHWRELETAPDTYSAETKYDVTATMQTDTGLNVLQVFHTLPKWVVESAPDRDPRCPDLRHVYAFCKSMAARFSGRVLAWEPWNEGNARNFGGWTIDELCSLQKAAFLGFKSADPGVIVGWNPLGGINTASLVRGILANDTWPYYDTYNIHSYDWPHAYEALWEPAREAACGRPIWVTECDRGIEAEEDSTTGDLSAEYDLRKAELIAQEYASSLHAGAARHFHFVLGHYMEGRIQFGLLHRDLTPRPGYVALAAAGRFLAGAVCLGRWSVPGEPNTYVIAFRARPDGVERDVIVAWAEEPADWPQRGRVKAEWTLPESVRVESAFDYLGRPLANGAPKELRSAPAFLLLPAGETAKMSLSMPPASVRRDGAPSLIVLQLQWPQARVAMHKEAWTEEHDYQAASGSDTELRIYVYNFGTDAAQGSIRVSEMPSGWEVTPDSQPIEIEPMDRKQVIVRVRAVTGSSPEPPSGYWV